MIEQNTTSDMEVFAEALAVATTQATSSSLLPPNNESYTVCASAMRRWTQGSADAHEPSERDSSPS